MTFKRALSTWYKKWGHVNVEDRLRRFAREEALAARVRSPHDVVQSYVAEIKDHLLRPYAGRFRQRTQETKSLKEELSAAVSRFEKRGRKRLYHIKAPFQEAQSSVPALVDKLIKSGESGSKLDQQMGRLPQEARHSQNRRRFSH